MMFTTILVQAFCFFGFYQSYSLLFINVLKNQGIEILAKQHFLENDYFEKHKQPFTPILIPKETNPALFEFVVCFMIFCESRV